MKTIEVSQTIYKTGDGTVTLDSGDGKNAAAFVSGAVISQELADRLGIPDLLASAKEEASDELGGLKPAATKGKATKPATPTQEAK